MTKYLITETRYAEPENLFYYVKIPDIGEPNFYRQVLSMSAFFQGLRNPRANVTEVRQFTICDPKEAKLKLKFFRKISLRNKLRVFENVAEFFQYIGYSPKTRSYQSGERLKTWTANGFTLPRKKRKCSTKTQSVAAARCMATESYSAHKSKR